MSERVWKRCGKAASAACAIVGALAGCGGITGVFPDEDISVEVQVSGGFAGVSYSFEVDGLERVVRGLVCESGCDFEPLEIFTTLSEAQIRQAGEDLRASGVLELDGVDFGTQCCDQFSYVITFEDGDRTSTVRGDSGTLPPLLLRAINALQAMMGGRLPIIVALDSGPDAFPADPLELGAAQVVGHLLEASISYGGGCANHEIDLVAIDGWLESFPVQVNVLLSHEDNDDPCDALVTETRSYDLSPLADAYVAAYGASGPNGTTVVLRLQDPIDPTEIRLIEYRF